MEFPLYFQIFLGQWQGVILEIPYGLFRVVSPCLPNKHCQALAGWFFLQMETWTIQTYILNLLYIFFFFSYVIFCQNLWFRTTLSCRHLGPTIKDRWWVSIRRKKSCLPRTNLADLCGMLVMEDGVFGLFRFFLLIFNFF